MRKVLAITFLATTVFGAQAQPAAAVRDGYSNEASTYLKKNPVIQRCVEGKVEQLQEEQKKSGIDPMIRSDQYGEFIKICADKSRHPVTRKKLQGDEIDREPNAPPNGRDEARNKRLKKPWQDNNGYVHFPDGSITSGPVD